MTPPDRAAAAFSEHGRAVEAFAARILLDREEARDVTSDAFAALVETGPDDERATLAWLLRSARNRAVDRIRVRERIRRLIPDRDRHEDDTERFLARAQVAGLVRTAIGRLEARDRRALELRFLDEQPYDAIAAALRTSEAQARVVVHRAASRMRRSVLELLAEHHGATVACRSRLADGVFGHAGCSPCGAVADEVAVLASFVLAPIAAPIASRIAARVGPAVDRVRVPREAGRFVEAAAALAMVGSLGIAPAAPAVDRIVVASPVRAEAPQPGARAVARAVTDRGRVRIAGRARHAVSNRDRSYDVEFTRSVSRAVPFVTVLDRIDTGVDTGVDIRRFRIETAMRNGRPHEVRFSWLVADAPRADEGFHVHWVGRDQCWADVGTSRLRALRGEGWMTARCGLGTGSDVLFDLPARATLGGARVGIIVSLDDVAGRADEVIGPGVVLQKLMSWTTYSTDDSLVRTSANVADYAPGFKHPMTYRIPE